MSLETLFAQRTPEAPSAQKRKTFIASKIFPVCCSCGLFRDEIRSSPDRERWVTQRRYQKAHGVNPANFPLTHTYCQKCFTMFQETVRQYFRENRTSP